VDEVPHEMSVVREDRGEGSGEEECSGVEMGSEESFDEPCLQYVRLRCDGLSPCVEISVSFDSYF
jgi:hypothetical protein